MIGKGSWSNLNRPANAKSSSAKGNIPTAQANFHMDRFHQTGRTIDSYANEEPPQTVFNKNKSGLKKLPGLRPMSPQQIDMLARRVQSYYPGNVYYKITF